MFWVCDEGSLVHAILQVFVCSGYDLRPLVNIQTDTQTDTQLLTSLHMASQQR